MTRISLSIMATLLLLNGTSALAAERIDYDLDDDGLIEIEDLQDLNEIRNNFEIGALYNEFKGQTLYNSSDGCPTNGCNGYELMSDLDFDTNNNGTLDEQDLFWNEGKGWDPIGSFSEKYVAEFNGNGHTLHNFVMRRPGETFVGLFAYSELSNFHDFSLSANFITGAESGGILGYSWRTEFKNLNLDIVIVGEPKEDDCVSKCVPNILGGIVGTADESSFTNIVMKADITGLDRLGGIVGQGVGDTNSHINEIAIQANINGDNYIGALAGTLRSYKINTLVAVANITGHRVMGGLIGEADDFTLRNVLMSGALLTAEQEHHDDPFGGGLIGRASEGDITNIISLMRLPSDPEDEDDIGALMISGSALTLAQVYWAQDLAGTSRKYGSNSQMGAEQNDDLVDIQCATASEACNGLTFIGFDAELNTAGQALWEFGSNQEAPVMALTACSFGDTDGNGKMDSWPVITTPVGGCSAGSSSGAGGGYLLLCLLSFLLPRRFIKTPFTA